MVPGGGIVQRKKPLELHFFNKADTVGTLLPPPLRISGGVWASEEMVCLFQHWFLGGKKSKSSQDSLKEICETLGCSPHPKNGLADLALNSQNPRNQPIFIYRSLSTICSFVCQDLGDKSSTRKVSKVIPEPQLPTLYYKVGHGKPGAEVQGHVAPYKQVAQITPVKPIDFRPLRKGVSALI